MALFKKYSSDVQRAEASRALADRLTGPLYAFLFFLALGTLWTYGESRSLESRARTVLPPALLDGRDGAEPYYFPISHVRPTYDDKD
jgi:hypothetical protein